MPSLAAYVYCLVRAATRPPSASSPSGIPGAGAPDALPVSPGLWVIVADVPLDAYGPDALESSLRNLDWVSRVAVAHEAVVEHFIRARGATVVPMKLFTMFATRERAVEDMRRRRRQVGPIFRRIAAADEWGVRITRQARPPSRPAAQRVASGAAFLAAKKRARDEAAASDAAAVDSAETAFTALRRIARAATRRDDAPATGVTPPLLDAAFLVPRTKRAVFKAAARRAAAACRRTGGSLSLTGPWPAYNFVQPNGKAS
jgi:hypothetical protein